MQDTLIDFPDSKHRASQFTRSFKGETFFITHLSNHNSRPKYRYATFPFFERKYELLNTNYESFFSVFHTFSNIHFDVKIVYKIIKKETSVARR